MRRKFAAVTAAFNLAPKKTAGNAPTAPEFISYKDRWVKIVGSLLASHFVLSLGRDESLFDLLLKSFYYRDLLSGALIALILWESVSRITKYLDKRFDWSEQPVVRSFLQITFGVFLLTVVLHLLTYLQYTYIIGQKMSDTSWFEYELPICIVLIILINTFYLTYYFFYRYQHLKQRVNNINFTDTPAPSTAEAMLAKKKRQVFIVNKGQRNIPVPVEDIAFFYKKDEYNYLRTFSNETHLVDESLEDIYAKLDENMFFRANRQTILNFHTCHYYSCLEFGKLEVSLLPIFKESVIISQKRAPVFKEWLIR